MSNREFDSLLKYEKSQYFEKFHLSPWGYFKATFFKEPISGIMKWQINSRKCDYYSEIRTFKGKVLAQYYRFLRNYYGRKMNIEASTYNIGKGLLLFHSGGIIINGAAIIGENVKLHGDNCIGNGGNEGNACPRIGNGVTLGVGAKVIGDVEIADGITIGAGAVVVKSFIEPNVTLAGVPARIITHK